ncbi:hypothetical protein [Chelativorans sp.]|uniref:hypothetical protein n=1 Tax=Chelativorans sp. TaxID=2203393 RepID=UPI0028118B1F|nr:hypothetical protein [Chelativorans sp.]
MRIIDTVISREGENSAWVHVEFLGDNGESVSVRLPCAVPSGSEAGRNHIIKRATALLRNLVTCDAFDTLGETVWSVRTGRFGVALEPAIPAGDGLRSWARSADE